MYRKLYSDLEIEESSNRIAPVIDGGCWSCDCLHRGLEQIDPKNDNPEEPRDQADVPSAAKRGDEH